MPETDVNRLNLKVYLKLVLIAIALICVDLNEAEIPELISRRHGGDSVTIYNVSSPEICRDGNNLTYVIEEQRCARDQDFLNSCVFSITPNQEFLNITLTLAVLNQQSSNMLLIGATVNSSSMSTDAVVIYRGTNHPVNGSLCLISSLEVYRGRDQITEIESDGFSLNETGFVEIDTTDLAYSFEEYLGELYRMNLSCSGEGLPESGCLFFKVIGITNVTSAKFNDRVSGTIYGREVDVPTTNIFIGTTSTESTSDSDTSTSTPQPPTLLPTTLQMSNTTNAPGGVDSRTLMYAIYVIAAVGVVALLVVVILLCAVIAFLCCSSDKNKKKREQNPAVDLIASTNLPSEPSDSKPATVPVNIPITQQELPPPPKWDPYPAYNVTELSTSWNEGSNL